MMKNKIKMSKAEDLSRQYVLPLLDEQYKKYGERKQMELTRFDGYDMMSAYEEGYHQAEKDLELTWEYVSKIKQIMFDYNRQLRPEIVGNKASLPIEEEYCREVLNRFKKGKG